MHADTDESAGPRLRSYLTMTAPQPTRATPEAYAAMMADPAYRARLEAVMSTLIADYEWYMAYGSETQRFMLMKTSLPDMLRARRAEEETSKDAAMRAAFQRMREGFREHIKVNVPDVNLDGVA